MDLATIIGVFGAFGVIIAAIALSGSASTFVNPAGLIVVIGGTLGATMMQISLKQFLGSFKIALRAFINKPISPASLIDEAVELADVSRKEGILALEGRKISDPFLQEGIRMCIDGQDAEIVQKVLSKDINLTLQRQNTGAKTFKAVGESAPAMGMIGTLIGLVQMLANMDDPKSIGPAMAVALLTTLYGAIIASAFALPIAAKLTALNTNERLNKLLILESVAAIQEGTNPRILRQMLTAFLPEDQRENGKSKKKKK